MVSNAIVRIKPEIYNKDIAGIAYLYEANADAAKYIAYNSHAIRITIQIRTLPAASNDVAEPVVARPYAQPRPGGRTCMATGTNADSHQQLCYGKYEHTGAPYQQPCSYRQDIQDGVPCYAVGICVIL